MPFFHSPESQAEIFYEVEKGLLPENTLFIHGNLASSIWWNPLKKELAGFTKTKTKNLNGVFLTADFRGCGQSSAPKTSNDVNVMTMAKDFIALLEFLQLRSVHLVGHSTGGLIAACMLTLRADLFKSSLLLDPVGAKGVKLNPAIPEAFKQMKTNKELTAQVIGSTIHGLNPEDPFFKNEIVNDAYKSVQNTGTWVLDELSDLDFTEKFKKVQTPVLVLHGEHDLLLPSEDSRDLAEAFPLGKFEIVQGLGHCGNYEKPALIQDYLQKLF